MKLDHRQTVMLHAARRRWAREDKERGYSVYRSTPVQYSKVPAVNDRWWHEIAFLITVGLIIWAMLLV